MPEQIYCSSKDYGTGEVLMIWDGDRPTDEQFRNYAQEHHGVVGHLEVEMPRTHKGLKNPSTATVTPN